MALTGHGVNYMCQTEDSEAVYVYRKRKQSIMSTDGLFHYRCMLKVADKLLEYAENETCEYKKLFLYRCAYKNASQVYWNVRSMSKPSIPIKDRKKSE